MTVPHRVALMITCLADVFYPEVGERIVRLLRRVGVEVSVPAAQTCCGLPLFNSGFHAEARAVARRTATGFAPAEVIGAPVSSELGEWNVLVAPDASFLVFEASGRATNVSESGDLYVSFRTAAGWTEPANLSEINTAGSELNARLSPDGEWLYFVSSGREGSGETDVYRVPAALLDGYR